MKRLFLFFLGFFFFFLNGQKQNSIQVLDKFKAKGCGDFRVLRKIKFENKENTYVILDFNIDKFQLSNEFQKLDLHHSPAVSGLVEILNKENTDNYCTDAINSNIETLKSMKIISGTAYVRKVKDGTNSEYFNRTPYIVDVILENACFIKDGKKYYIKNIKFINVYVSFMIG